MRKRNLKINLYFTAQELAALDEKVARTSMSREAYLRALIERKTPITTPSKDYFRLAKEMRAAGNTLNRIAAALYSRGFLDVPAYQRNAEKVLCIADEMHMALAPRKEC